MNGMKEGLLVTNDVKENLADAIKDFITDISNLSAALKACREEGLNVQDMHQVIMDSVPEEDRPAFQQQWPMISMLLSAL
jgi:hypothetical protein